MAIRPGLTIKGPGAKDLIASLRSLATKEILVGYPASTSERKDDEEDEGASKDITNAALGYIHEHGDPENNVPARPHLGPAIAGMADVIENDMRAIAQGVLNGRDGDYVAERMDRLGAKAVVAVKNKINDGVPPPLADATVARRASRKKNPSKSAMKELKRRAAGGAPDDPQGYINAKPLADTKQMRDSVNYVIRPRSLRKR